MWRYCTSRRRSPGSSLLCRPSRPPATGNIMSIVVPSLKCGSRSSFWLQCGSGSSFPHFLLRIRIWILLLIKVMQIYEHWSVYRTSRLHFESPRLYCERSRLHFGPLKLHFRPLKLLRFYFNGNPDLVRIQFFPLMLIRIWIQLPKTMRIRVHNPVLICRHVVVARGGESLFVLCFISFSRWSLRACSKSVRDRNIEFV